MVEGMSKFVMVPVELLSKAARLIEDFSCVIMAANHGAENTISDTADKLRALSAAPQPEGETVALANEAEWCVQVLEDIGGMQPSWVEGDEVEMSLEDENGNSCTCTVSITEFSRRSATLIRQLLKTHPAHTALDQVVALQSTLRNALQALEHGEIKEAIDQIEEALSPEDEA
jgi:hypothetical protein